MSQLETRTLTAVELVAMLREQGYFIARSRAYRWAVIPRVAADDPMLDWLRAQGACARPWQPEQVTNPELVAYEVSLLACEVADADGPLAIWEAAARTT
jgi:hypothetical protein